jgi:hypothetical protein
MEAAVNGETPTYGTAGEHTRRDPGMRRPGLLAALVAAVACFGLLEVSAALAQGRWSAMSWVDVPGNIAPAAVVPAGYWVDVDESGTTTSSSLGGGGSLSATGTGNVNYGWGEECAPSSDGGPFSSGRYPPATCPEVGRSYSSTGSPESPPGFWFTGNQHCVAAGRKFSGATFTWHVQLPQTGPWHVEVYIPSWTSYGWGNQYILTAADGRFENAGFIQQAYHGQWVQLFGSHQFNAGQDYTVELTLADTSDSYCHYQMADQMKWVYDGFPPTVPTNNTPPTISGEAVEGQTLTGSHGTWTNSPTSYGYQWEDCDTSGSSCTAIYGATSQSYTLTTSDVGHTIVVRETANNEAGPSAPAYSLPTKPVVTPEQAAKQHEVTLPTVTKTTQQKNTHEKPEPPVCAPTPQPAQPAHVHVDKRLVRRIVHGAKRLLGAHSVRVTLSLMLCGTSAREAGIEPGTQLTGHGIVDASRARARWTITLPSSLGGKTLNVISHGNETYIQAASLGLPSRKPWIRLRGREFAKMRRLGFLGTLAADTNPAAGVGIASDTSPEGANGTTAHASRSAVESLLPVRAASSSCNITGGATLSGPLDLNNDKAIIERFKSGRDALSTIRSASKDIRSITKLSHDGTLASVTFKLQTDGLTITDDLCPEAAYDPSKDPVSQSIPNNGSFFALDPCLVGDWILHQEYPRVFPDIPETGSVALAITPTGATTVMYLLAESAQAAYQLPAPQVYDGAPYYTSTTTWSPTGNGLITLTGTAAGEVLAPLVPGQQDHRIIWAAGASGVTRYYPGIRQTVTGEKGESVIEGEEVILEETPFDEVIETLPTEFPESWSVNSSSYECDEKQGVGTLKVTLPIGWAGELEFWRSGRNSNG